MDGESLLIIGGAIIFLYFIFKSDNKQDSSHNITSASSYSRSGVSSNSGSYLNLDVGSDWDKDADTIWQGVSMNIYFSYGDRYGESTKRNIRLERIIRKNGARYLQGYCYLRKAKRTFAVSRIQKTIMVNSHHQPKLDFVNQLLGKNTQTKTTKSQNLQFADTKKSRQQAVTSFNHTGNIDWRQEGILSLSGYRVGKSKGISAKARQAIINSLMLNDDLSDITDRGYANEWGTVKTLKRYKKIENSINTFLGNAKGRSKSGKIDLSKAISDWESDLRYLKRSHTKSFR